MVIAPTAKAKETTIDKPKKLEIRLVKIGANIFLANYWPIKNLTTA